MTEENEILDEKLEALLDANDKFEEFCRNHPGSASLTNPEVVPGGITFDSDVAPERQELFEAFESAKAEYESSVRKDERERIKTIILEILN